MTDEGMQYTWDGKPISRELPNGVSVVVFRRDPELSFLILHRSHQGKDYEGPWAWTPPSGARLPEEAVAEAARRELYEEAGLVLELEPTALGTPEWWLYIAEARMDQRVVLVDPEHDRYCWVTAEEAVRRVEPEVVRESLVRAVDFIVGQGRADPSSALDS